MQKSKIQFKINNLIKNSKTYTLYPTTSLGFTLIELLIVIVIIGILSSILLSNFIGIRQRARDGTRKSDLRQMQAALELYRADFATYPADSSGTLGDCGDSFKDTGGTIYMKSIPCDPLGESQVYNGGKYFYKKTEEEYTLAACLENGSDSQGTATAPVGSSGCPTINKLGGGSTGWYHVLTNP